MGDIGNIVAVDTPDVISPPTMCELHMGPEEGPQDHGAEPAVRLNRVQFDINVGQIENAALNEIEVDLGQLLQLIVIDGQ
jgi:hypothetical protein